MDNKTTFLSLHHAKLIIGFTHKTLRPGEHDELDKWIEESDDNMEIFEELIEKVVHKI